MDISIIVVYNTDTVVNARMGVNPSLPFVKPV